MVVNGWLVFVVTVTIQAGRCRLESRHERQAAHHLGEPAELGGDLLPEKQPAGSGICTDPVSCWPSHGNDDQQPNTVGSAMFLQRELL